MADTARAALAADLRPSEPQAVFLSPSQIDPILRQHVGEKAQSVSAAILGIAFAVHHQSLTPDDAEGVVQSTLRSSWSDEVIRERESALKLLVETACDWPMQALCKAVDLSFAHSVVSTDLRIITDSRAVFSPEGDSIVGVVVSQTLRVEVQRDGKAESIDISIDESDLILLGEQCERAIKKASVLKNYFSSPFAIPTTVAGAEDDGTTP